MSTAAPMSLIHTYKITAKKLSLELIYLATTAAFFFPARRALVSLLIGEVGRNTTIHGFVRFFDYGKLKIGHNSTINRWCYIDNRGGVTIGSNVNISHDCRIYTMGHDINDPMASTICRSVTIGDDVWIFPGARIMPGVSIGRGAVVFPGALVTKDVAALTVVGGAPAKRIGERSANIQYSANFPVHFST